MEVADNGVGIPRENLTRIFAHGFTTQTDGHGFGLHSGALTAKDLGGTLMAYSKGAGQGASFVLELPLQHQAAAAANLMRAPRSEDLNSAVSASPARGRPASPSSATAMPETRAG
jgi:hypothetical protein